MSGRRPRKGPRLPEALPKSNSIDNHELFQLNYREQLYFSKEEKTPFRVNDFEDNGILGEGNFGEVRSMIYRPTGQTYAIKKIPLISEESALESIRRDVDHMWKSRNSNYIVQFYGYTIHDGQCWICMEALTCSLKDFYPKVHEKQKVIPEIVLVKITICVVKGLSFLKANCDIVHRDIKPANILLDKCKGFVKLCDFGISAQLVDSIAKTRGVGTKKYLSPERIKGDPYDIRADVWALGVSIMELANGRFPYDFTSVMQQITEVVGGRPLEFNNPNYTVEFRDFILRMTSHLQEDRPKYQEIMQSNFFVRGEQSAYDLQAYFDSVLR